MIITVGAFDGFHKGHAELLDAARELAAETGQDWGVVTFDPHPEVFLGGLKGSLFTPREREAAGHALGIPHIFTLKFDDELRNLSPADFWLMLKRYLDERGMKIGGAVAGSDFTFGHDAAGTSGTLTEFCRAEGLPVRILRLKERGGAKYSSTAARRAVTDGDMRGAWDILGYPWFMISRVTCGNQRGREMGFPTANLELAKRKLIPCSGVYAAAAAFDGKWHPAALSVGDNPTFGDIEGTRAEAFIIGFSGDLYGREIELAVLERLRPMMKFESAAGLAARIEKDTETCAAVFGKETENDRFPLPPEL